MTRTLRVAAAACALSACGPDLYSPSTSGPMSTGPDAGTHALDLAGDYQCTISGEDTRADCGGPVYLSSLSGQALPMVVTQHATSVELGIWGIIMEGSVSSGSLSASYDDTKCYSCSPQPVHTTLSAKASDGQLSSVHVRMWQLGSGYADCEKTYTGVCARMR